MPSEQHRAAAAVFGRALFLAELGQHAIVDTRRWLDLPPARALPLHQLVSCGRAVEEFDQLDTGTP